MAVRGDIALVGYFSDGSTAATDTFSFLILADLSGQTINFTDNGWLSAGGFRGGEGVVSYVVPAGTPIGTVVTLSGAGNFNLSTGGDSIIAYTGTAAAPTNIFALDFANAAGWDANAADSNTSAVPTGLTAGSDALSFAADNAAYTGPRTGTRAEILANIANAANWTQNDASAVPYGGNFTVATQPTGAFSINDQSIAEGDAGTTPITFTVTRAGGSSGSATVDWAVAFTGVADPASAADFSGPTSGTLTFADGVTSQTITLSAVGDTAVEPDENFRVALSNNTTGTTLADGEGLGTIVNDDVAAPPAAAVWINEFHYDDAGADEGEFIEVAGTAGTDLTGYSLVLYNGSGGAPYGTIALSGIIDNEQNGLGALSFPAVGLQNGSPDGIALVGPGGVIEFISYEGSFVANGGPANGMTSTDVGVIEPGTAHGTSIGRVGTGDEANDFTWALIGDDTPGSLNNGQSAPGGGVTPTVSIGDVTIAEGDSGTTNANFTVTLSAAATGTVTVAYATGDGTATAGSDYTASSGIVTFAPGETSQTISVPVIGDTTVESDETFTVTLSAPSGATLGDASGTGTITNDDTAAPPAGATPFINEFHYDNSGTDAGEFVEIAGAAGLNLSGYSIVLYNGNGGASYNTLALSGIIANQQNGFGTLSFAYPSNGIQNGGAGTATEPDGIALVGPDGVIEFISYEGTFVASGGPASGMTSTDVGVAETGSANGTSIGRVGTGNEASDFTWALIGDDTPGGVNQGQTFAAATPAVSVSDVSVTEGDSGATFATFTVTRSGPADAFSVAYATADGTATTANSDYVAISGVLNFAAGQNSAQVTVQVNGDTFAEGNETFFLNLSGPTNGATLADGQGQATIVNDDGLPPTVTINDVALGEGNSGVTPFTFTVTRSGGTGAFSVDYVTTGGTASVGSDYAPASGTLTFAEGQTSQQITVLVNGDTNAEPSETFNVMLFNPTGGALLADNIGTGTIVNDDLTSIHDIQGTAYFSPILAAEGINSFNIASNATVTIQAVVTAVDGEGARQGFYLTEESDQWDDNAFSSEGIFVMTRNDSNAGVTLDSYAPGLQVGDIVTVSAKVMEYQAFQNQARTVLVNPLALTVDSDGNPLPIMFLDSSRPIPNEVLTAVTPDYMDSFDNPGDTFDASAYALSYFETVEGMLVQLPDMVVADGFVGVSGGQPFLKAYSTVHANADQINSRGGYTIAGDPPLAPPNTPETVGDDTNHDGRHLHDGDVNPDIVELDFTDFAIDAPAGLTQNASMGDHLGDVYGIIDFDFTDLKLFVSYIDPDAITNGQPEREVTTLPENSGALTVATFNVENLDPTDGSARFAQIADAIAHNLSAPDILSIEEIQDNNGAAAGDGISSTGTDASQTWTMLVNAVNAATGGHYQWVDQAPVYNAEGGEQSGNIRVGFLYNTDRVQLGDLAANASLAERRQFTDRIGDGVRDAGDRITYSDNMIGSEINTADWSNTRKSLLGQFTFQSHEVFVAANHLPSKGGSGEFWQLNQNLNAGQPANSDWDQRSAIGQDLYTMLNLVQSGSPSSGVVAGGDFNDFYFYRPLEAATGYVNADGTARNDGLKLDNLTLTLAEAERYTYAFDGRNQAIDHILVNQLLRGIASYDVVHINTGYNERGTGADASPALSDHDPALASFDFGRLLPPSSLAASDQQAIMVDQIFASDPIGSDQFAVHALPHFTFGGTPFDMPVQDVLA